MSQRRHTVMLVGAVAVAAASACYTGPRTEAPYGTYSTEPTSNADPTLPEGLPCEIASILAEHCTECHGDRLERALTRLLTRDQLLADFHGRPLGVEAAHRMRATEEPMPPNGRLSEEQIATFEKWALAGMPLGTCSEISTRPGPIELTCTSDSWWTRGDHGSKKMTPGRACIACHMGQPLKTLDDHEDDDDQGEDDGPLFSFAGTVYPVAHDADDCNGLSDPETRVVLTGADGATLTLPINEAGNFMTEKQLAFPVTAAVVNAAGTRTMKDPIAKAAEGDCNFCHTADSVSGRIVPKQ